MEFSFDSSDHPILQLKQDVSNFLEAVDPEPGSQLHDVGHQFSQLLQQLHDYYVMEYAIEHMELCFAMSEETPADKI